MDLLQIALILLIVVIAIFLSIGGWMVFLILKDLRKALIKLNEILNTDSTVAEKIKQQTKTVTKPKVNLSPSRRFFKKGF